MSDANSFTEGEFPAPRDPPRLTADALDDLLPTLELIAERPGMGESYTVGTGYGMAEPGDQVLLAASNLHEPLIVDGVTSALRGRGCDVDIVEFYLGEDQERRPEDELVIAITNLSAAGIDLEPQIRVGAFHDQYSEYLGRWKWVEEVAASQGYDMVIQSQAGPIQTQAHLTGEPYHYERLPWRTTETLLSPATTFPPDLYDLINRKNVEKIWGEGKGGTVHLTDPEGTDLTYTLWDEWVEQVTPFQIGESQAVYDGYTMNKRGHNVARPWTPVAPSEQEDSNGVIAGTVGHYNSPHPRLELHIEDGRVEEVTGGGDYGDLVRRLAEATGQIPYPDFPRPGLLWVQEIAIGTNPKMFRPTNFVNYSGPGTLAERLRSGYIHVGIGTTPLGVNEPWAAELGHPYGHIHLHLMFPTLEIRAEDGHAISVIDRGRLSVLDDPDVRALAAEYGEPDELLREDWIPAVPGINADGSYDDYASDPMPYV